MYYHILVKHSNHKKDTTSFLCDLSFEKVEELTKLYISEQDFLVNGYIVNKSCIDRFKICETKDTIENEMHSIRNRFYSAGIAALGISEDTVINGRGNSKDVTEEFVKKALSEKNALVSKNTFIGKNNSKNVFIVHGHDTNRLESIENLVRKLGYNPIVLFKEPDGGKTIIEKIENYSGDVCFCIVLYTKCDIGYEVNKQDEAKYRARQNVVFEHGFMIGTLGREKVCAVLENDDIETPGDISGVIYVRMTNDEIWQLKIAKNMKASGLDIDLNIF